MLTLSLIIPVYDEERHIRSCLDAVAAQTIKPLEVIVVDNNCTDNTIEIARKYPFVKIVKEKKQGRGHARAAGFSAAKGDILGRIDADSVIAPNWVEEVVRMFSADPELEGLTGLANAPFLPGINLVKSTFFSRFYYWFAHSSFDTVTMWGANMAIRQRAWERVMSKVYDIDLTVHEDQDVSLWIAASGGKIIQDNDLRITVNGQGFRYLPKLILYSNMFKHTKLLHKENGNLDSPSLRRLGFWSTLPGRIASNLIWVVFGTPFSIGLFPIDFIIKKIWPKSWWLD